MSLHWNLLSWTIQCDDHNFDPAILNNNTMTLACEASLKVPIPFQHHPHRQVRRIPLDTSCRQLLSQHRQTQCCMRRFRQSDSSTLMGKGVMHLPHALSHDSASSVFAQSRYNSALLLWALIHG